MKFLRIVLLYQISKCISMETFLIRSLSERLFSKLKQNAGTINVKLE